MAARTIVVVGGALAGPTAAARARELDDHARIVLVERNVRVSYAVGALAYHLSGEVAAIDALDREDRGFFEAFYRVEVQKETEAIALDPAARTVTLRRRGPSGSFKDESLAWDALIYAPGAETIRPPEVAGDNVRPLRTVGDLEAISAALHGGARRFLVLGGGSFGLEAADGLLRGGAEVTLVERGHTLLPRFGDHVSAAVLRALSAKADVRLGVTAVSSEARDGRATEARDGRVHRVILSDGTTVDTDWVVLATGVKPRTSLLAAAGVRLHEGGSAAIDDRARTSAPGIFACGSCVAVESALTGQPVWWPQAAIADKTAQVAGANAAGADERLFPFTGSMLVRVLDLAVGRTGASWEEARATFGDVARTLVHARSNDPFFPGAAPIALELIWSRADGRVLGVEAVGAGVDKRIDAAAAAIAARMTIEQLARLDLGYSPPYAAARDPLNVVATAASAERAGLGRSITAREVRAGTYVLLDVGTERAPLPGARHIPITELRDRLGELDRDASIVVCSGSGRHGWLAVRILAQHGFSDVHNLAGGVSSLELTS
ncbi:MAG: FAD-dependent oxidoreductase [Deltaproteobacteria bacterium]|nr:FAD-dependent oxidoreductase [Deltaproteobacteria bacterium]